MGRLVEALRTGVHAGTKLLKRNGHPGQQGNDVKEVVAWMKSHGDGEIPPGTKLGGPNILELSPPK